MTAPEPRSGCVEGRRVPLETAIQREIVSVIRQTVFPCEVRAVPNSAGKLGMRARVKLRREGLMPGTLDLIVAWPGGCGFMEIKRPGYTASAVSSEQSDLITLWRGWGHNVGIASTPDEAIALLRLWGAPVRVQSAVRATPAPILECFAGVGE